MKLTCYWLLIFLVEVHCFNIDTDFPIIYSDPSPKTDMKTYFGYTVAMHPENGFKNQWVIIGAPRGNDTSYPEIERPGIVYNCEAMMGCKKIDISHSIEQPIEKWNRGMFGGTMDVSYKHKRIAICAYRQYYETGERDLKDHRAMGACYWSKLNETNFKIIKPMLNTEYAIYKFKNAGSVYLYGQAEGGFSAHFPEHENELILGAPGTFNWAGNVFKVKDYVYDNPDISRRRRSRERTSRQRRSRDILNRVEVPDATRNEVYKLFGYSVTSGYYYGHNNLYYASGSPKANQYKGRVRTFQFGQPDHSLQIEEEKIGEGLGEYFGASLASGNVNGDQFDDLLVGAPFSMGDSYNEGRVYVFLGASGNLKGSTILKGQSQNAQFGTSIMYLGDIDLDGFGDVAIGAPYEYENSGVVYIYRGIVDGLQQKPCQTIIGKELYPELLGFGVTISKAIDMDENKFKDITVGAPLSSHAVLLRSRPIVAVKYTFEPIPKILPATLKNFQLKICFSYSLFDAQLDLPIKYTLKIDGQLKRAMIGNNSLIQKNLTLYQDEVTCEDFNVTILDSTTLDVKIPLLASLSYSLNYIKTKRAITLISDKVEKAGDLLCPRCAILDEEKSNTTMYETEIAFSLGCKDNICHSFLDIDFKFPELMDNTLVLGSLKYIKLEVNVTNLGENAYSTKLKVDLPALIYFREVPQKCKPEGISSVICDIENPLRNDSWKVKKFELDVQQIEKIANQDHLDILFQITTSSNNTNYGTQMASLNLTRQADVTIYGTLDQETNDYGNSSAMVSALTHIFKIEKFGASSLEKLKVKIKAPHKYQIEDRTIEFLNLSLIDASFGGQPFVCDSFGISVTKAAQHIDFDETLPTKRRRRQVEIIDDLNILKQNKNAKVLIKPEEFDIKPNRTLYLNCTTDGVTCFDVICSFGPYYKDSLPASIKLKMMLDMAAITEFASDKDTVLYSSSGEVIVEIPENFIQYGQKKDSVIISSLFINDKTKPVKVALWIIIVAIIAGLILLLILVLFLIRIGFFKRTKKEELKNLKMETEQEEKILAIIENSRMQDEEPFEEVEVNGGDEQDSSMQTEDQEPFSQKNNSSKEHLCDT